MTQEKRTFKRKGKIYRVEIITCEDDYTYRPKRKHPKWEEYHRPIIRNKKEACRVQL